MSEKEHYYVCYYSANKERMIAAGPNVFIDKDDYPPEEGFYNENEAWLAMCALKESYPGVKAFIVKKVN